MAATLYRYWRSSPSIFQNFKYLSARSSSLSKSIDDQVTHTGQKFDENDKRLARFLGKEGKLVNPHFAIDLINSIPPKPVKERVVWCDGGGGALGHPKVYINLVDKYACKSPFGQCRKEEDQPGPQACGYCGLRFVLEHHH